MARIDTSGASGRDGANGRPGRPGKDGRHLKKGGRSRGGNGTAGTAGKNGTKGKKARNVRGTLSVSPRGLQYKGTGGTVDLSGGLVIDASGGRGGDGGNGGRGGRGGYGNPSGDRGRDGSGGDGADGGDGGNVTLTTADSHLFGLLVRVDVSGGRGGSGGYGSPGGSSGSSGSDGELLLIHKNKKLGYEEEDDRFGVTIGSLDRTFDASLLDGNATRGTVFTIDSVRVRNACSITIPAPFAVRVGGEGPLAVPSDILMVDSGVLGPRGSRTALGAITAKVAERCDIGYFALNSSAWSAREGTPIHLGSGSADNTYVVPVNHRLDIAAARGAWTADDVTAPTEDELAEDEEGLIPYGPALRQARKQLALPDEHLVFLGLLGVDLNKLSPDSQMAAYSALLLARFLQMEESEPGKLDARLEEMAAILEGRLTSRDEFIERFHRYAAMGEHAEKVTAVLAAASDFFGSLNRDTRGKILDAAYFGASTDGYIDPGEKRMLLTLTAHLGFDCDWVDEHMPQLRKPGVSTATAEKSNRPAIGLIPLAAFGLLMGALALLHPEPAFFLGLHTSETGAFSLVALAALAFAIAAKVMDRASFNLACRSCASVRLASLDASRSRLMIGDADGYRCLDCGARGTREVGSDRQLFHPERGLAGGADLGGPMIAVSLLVLGLVLRAVDSGSGITDVGTLMRGALLVLGFWLVWPFERVHRVSVAWAVVPAVAWLAMMVFLGMRAA